MLLCVYPLRFVFTGFARTSSKFPTRTSGDPLHPAVPPVSDSAEHRSADPLVPRCGTRPACRRWLMRPVKRILLLVTILGLSWQCSGDSGSGPEDEQPCSTTGTADDALFNQHFIRMALVDRATGLPGQTDPELGERYPRTSFLELRMDAKAPVSVRACVEVRDGSGKVTRSVTHSAIAGSSGAELGTFEPNAAGYVLRVTVGGTLVKNF